jgi:serine/threonine protein kinase
MIATCPEQLLLDEYLAGKSSRQFHDDFESHLRECRECQARLSQFNPTEDSLMRVLRDVVLADGDAAARDSQNLSSALASIAQLTGQPTVGLNGNDSQANRVIRDYELKKKLGEGGMGAVYLALHTRLKKQVAVKLLKADRGSHAGAIARFAVEIEAVGKLEHPNIVRALDAGEENGTHFLVMEYLPGIDLARLVRGLGPLGVADTCEIIRQAALGLHHAHENDIVHRDVKPSNFILLPSGKVKVLDLGLAHFRPALHESVGLTQEHQVLGTLLYVAPEQFSASEKVDSRSDIYSLGVTLYELLLGRLPSRQGLVVSPTAEELAARPDVPPEIWALAAKMTSVNRDDRPSSMLAVADAARPYAAGANLASLLQQLMGQSTLEEQHVAGGVGSGSPSHWPAVFVTPPPPPAAYLSTAVGAPLTTQPRQREPWPWKAAAALLTAACLLLVVALAISSLPKSPPPAVVPPELGLVFVGSKDPAYQYQEIFNWLLDHNELTAVRVSDGETFQLHRGENKLPIGDYRLKGTGPEITLLPKVFPEDVPEAQRTDFTVTAGSESIVTPNFKFNFNPLFPHLPDKQDAFCTWTGGLWHASLGPPEKELRFELTLTMLGGSQVNSHQHRWLKLEVKDQAPQGIIETVWLLVDWKEWEENQIFSYDPKQAWLQASSKEIKETLQMEFAESPPESLVAAFSDENDALADAASKVGVALPRERIMVHHALVLLFNADLPAAPAWVRKMRSDLPTKKQYSLNTVGENWGGGTGLVVKAESPLRMPVNVEASTKKVPTVSLLLERSELSPFSFTHIDVKCPGFLHAWIKGGVSSGWSKSKPSLTSDPVVAAPRQLPKWSQMAERIAGLVRLPHPIYLPSLPPDHTVADYTGYITLPASKISPELTINHSFTLKMLGTERLSGDRWMEVTTSSGLVRKDHVETALLCIDGAAYENGSCKVNQGWLILGSDVAELADDADVFEFDPEGDISLAEEGLQCLNKPLPAARFGVHDLLSLMFDGKMKSSRLGAMREHFADERLLEGRVPAKKPGVHTRPDQTYNTAVWSLAAKEVKSPGEPHGGFYTIVRGPTLPFNYASAEITSPTNFFFKAVLKDFKVATPDKERGSLHSEKAKLNAAMKRTAKEIATETARPNWRMWTLNKAPYRLFAEFGGTDTGKVVLRTKASTLSVWDREDFQDEDREVIDRGREWMNVSGGKSFFGKLSRSDSKGLSFKKETGTAAALSPDIFAVADKQIIGELVKQLPKPEPLPPKKGPRPPTGPGSARVRPTR